LKFLKGFKSVLSFKLKRNPRIFHTASNYRKYIPAPHDCVVLISADFELAWAWRYSKKNMDSPIDISIELARRERNNIPLILSFCDEYNIPITWATVGHLFIKSCSKDNGILHPEIRRIGYFENKWWKYDSGDWFDSDPNRDFHDSPEWYCPDLIQEILDTKTKHEIGCHTFSHIPCNDSLCPPEVLESELMACKKAAKQFNISLESFIFPGHTMGNYSTIKKIGFTSVRTNYANVLGYPKLDEYGLWQHESTMELRLNDKWPYWYNLYRFKKIIKEAIKRKMVCHFWFHPSLPEAAIHTLFRDVFSFLNTNRKRIWLTSMNKYTEWLEANHEIVL
jgi:hypothetical protein